MKTGNYFVSTYGDLLRLDAFDAASNQAEFYVVDRSRLPQKDGWGWEYLALTHELMEVLGIGDSGFRFANGVRIRFMYNSFPLVLDVFGNRAALFHIEALHQLQELVEALSLKPMPIDENKLLEYLKSKLK